MKFVILFIIEKVSEKQCKFLPFLKQKSDYRAIVIANFTTLYAKFIFWVQSSLLNSRLINSSACFTTPLECLRNVSKICMSKSKFVTSYCNRVGQSIGLWKVGEPHRPPKSCKKAVRGWDRVPQDRKQRVWGTLHNKGTLTAQDFLKGGAGEEGWCPGHIVNVTVKKCSGTVT